jgi:hypothetical protein
VARLKREVPQASLSNALKKEGAFVLEMTGLVGFEWFGDLESNFDRLEENRDEQATVGGC